MSRNDMLAVWISGDLAEVDCENEVSRVLATKDDLPMLGV